MALATSADVAAYLGRSLTDEESTKFASTLVLVASAIKDYTGFRFEPGSYTISRVPRRGKVKVPAISPTVTAVAEVDEWDGSETAITDYTTRGATIYGLSYERVEVSFTAAAAVPDEIVTLAASLVGSVFAGPGVGVASEMTGPFQVSYVDNSGKVWFGATDKLILRKYKQLAASVSLVG
jgi:hypothetical protein